MCCIANKRILKKNEPFWYIKKYKSTEKIKVSSIYLVKYVIENFGKITPSRNTFDDLLYFIHPSVNVYKISFFMGNQ